MQPKIVRLFIVLTVCCIHIKTTAQTTIDSTLQTIQSISDKSLGYIDKKYSKLSNDVQKQSNKLLTRMQEKEANLQKKLQGIDSTKAKELFETSKKKYTELQTKVKGSVDRTTAKLKEYIPGLDSISTGLKFLSQPSLGNNLNTDKLNQLTGSVSQLQGRLQQANEIQSFIKERETQLKEALMNTGLGKELLSINKEVYYYQAKLKEYKELLNDRKKLEAKLINTIASFPAFQDFWNKHSYLATLFRLPGTYDASLPIPGLQTRTDFASMINQRYGGAVTNPDQYFQQQSQELQSQLTALKNKINQAGGSNSDETLPDFKPNDQKKKSFLKRIDISFDIQNTKSTSLLPTISDIALSIGYKFNNNASTGIGMSYKLGWGEGWQHVKFTNEGIGLRSYVDYKIKGSFWLNGGFEYNYLNSFEKLGQIKDIDVWQRSALIGIEKKYKITKNKEGKILLLYDFLANRNVPQASPFKFRIGWNL